MAETIVIDDSSEEEEEEEKGKSVNILEMDNLRDRLNQHFSSLCSDDESNGDGLVKWRTKLNPFREYGLLKKKEECERPCTETTNNVVGNGLCSKSNTITTTASKLDNEDMLEVNGKEPAVSNDGLDTGQPVVDSGMPCPKKVNLNKGGGDTLSTPVKSNDRVLELKQEGAITPKHGSTPPSGSSSSPNKTNTSLSNDDGFDLDTRMPYYLKNFMHIIRSVLKSDDLRLFNEQEVESLQQFQQVTDAAKKLYIRLYQRKRDWLRCDKIHYPKIADDLTSAFKELVDLNYLYNEDSLVDFDEVCNLLTAADAQNLAKDIKLKVSNTKNNSKTDIIKLLKKHCQKQRTIFQTKNNSMKSILSKRAKKLIGRCVKLKEDQRFLFTRIILLFSLTSHFSDLVQYNAYGSNLLYQMLLTDLGDVEYPTYTINREYEIFPTRLHFIDYAHLIEVESEFEMSVEKKDYTQAMKCYGIVRPKLLLVLEELLNSEEEIHCLKLPVFLSRFSKHAVTIRLANKCVDILEKERNYHEAVSLIELLLSQKFFRSTSRGFLWERLILDYERYIKDVDKAYLYTIDALKDPYVRTGHRFGILQRHRRLAKSPKVKPSSKNINFESLKEDITDPKEETIKASLFIEPSARNRAVFLSPSSFDDNVKLSNVEQHVITHYRDLGFPVGKHGEGSAVTTLFVLLFWDIIFMDLPDVFQSEFQNSPLDLFSDSFYINRKDELDKRIDFIYRASEETLRMTILDKWMSNHGTYSAGVNWDLFCDETEAADLAVCLGNKVLSGICELFCKDLRRRMSGFPDLIVWNIENKTCKIIEVKGPGDKLSVKQIVWLDVLSYLGADAFACHVTGVGGKRKRTNVD